jgi:hypothetical protein
MAWNDKVDWSGLNAGIDALGKGFQDLRKQKLQEDIFNKFQAGDYAGAAQSAARAGDLNAGLKIMELGQSRSNLESYNNTYGSGPSTSNLQRLGASPADLAYAGPEQGTIGALGGGTSPLPTPAPTQGAAPQQQSIGALGGGAQASPTRTTPRMLTADPRSPGYGGAPVSGGQGGTGASFVYNGLIARGISPVVAAGITGNIAGESSFNPGIVGDKGTSVGLAQWRGPRRQALEQFAASQGKDWRDPNAQIDYLVSELKGPEARAYAAVQGARTPEEASYLFMRHFERPADWAMRQSGPRRAAVAQQVYSQYGAGQPGQAGAAIPTLPGGDQPAQIASPFGQPTASLQVPQPAPQQVQQQAVQQGAPPRQQPIPMPAPLVSVLGEAGAVRFRNGTLQNPNAPATAYADPGVVQQNRQLFFDQAGQPRTAGQVMQMAGQQAPQQPVQVAQASQADIPMQGGQPTQGFAMPGQQAQPGQQITARLKQLRAQLQHPGIPAAAKEVALAEYRALLQQQARGPQQLPEAQRNYELAVRQGFRGTFMDYQQQLRQAGAAQNIIKNEGSIPPGYRVVRDEQGNPVQLEAIPGGPAERENREAAAKEQATAQKQALQRQQVNMFSRPVFDAIGDIRRLQSASTLPTTGALGGVAARVPGTGAYDIANSLNTIRANISFERLNQMRQASPTGGALGAVTEGEQKLLQNSLGALEQSQSTEQFNRNLARVEQIFRQIVDGPQGTPPMQPAAPKQQGAGGVPNIGDVQDGYRYRGGNPGSPSSWEPVQ